MMEQAITLPADATSAVRARQFVRDSLSSSPRGQAIEDAALLCVTELVANVARHTDSHECVVRVVDEDQDVTIEVMDECGEAPTVADGRDPMQETGRGLRIVEALADDWGVRSVPGQGKTIWLRF